jgi:predicted phage terminase large subunit-like protein
LPAEAQEYEALTYPISKKVYYRNKGEILHPEREGVSELESARKTMGTRAYSAQYNQSPTPAEGNIIKRAWLKYYDELPMYIDEKAIFADLAYKDGEENDFTVIETWARKGNCIYLVDQIRDHMDFPTQLQALDLMVKKHPDAMRKEIEEKANGAALIQMAKDKIMGLVANNPKTSKGARLAAASPLYEAGNVYYPNPDQHPWVEENIKELLAMGFAGTTTKHDDTADVASMAVNYFGQMASSVSRLEILGRR